MISSNRHLRNVSTFLLYLCAFSLGIKSFSEPDLWWQIRTGEWILSHHSVPHADLFSYTMAGSEWINVKWGFEVLAALVSSWLGPESVYLLQAVVAVLLFYFLTRLSGLFFSKEEKTRHTHWHFSLVLSFVVTVLAIEFRINGRPEMFSHLFTAVFLFYLVRYRFQPSNRIWMLPLLQIAWVNMHEAYATGLVILTLFLVGAWIEWRVKKQAEPALPSSLLRLSGVWLASLAALTVNPYGMRLLIRPFDILKQVSENKYTKELLPATTAGYWTTPAWIALGIIGVAATGMLFYFLNGKDKKTILLFERIGVGYLFSFFAFLFLAFIAYRNIIFAVIAAFPLLHYTLFRYLESPGPLSRVQATLPIVTVALPFFFYCCMVSNKYYEWSGSRTRFGLEVTSYNNPVGAARFIEEKGLKKKKCFSDYLTSSYLLWKLQPEFQTFIDLRDLDIFPASHFQKFLQAAYSPARFLALDSLYHFDYVVLFRPEFAELHAYLYNDTLYACTYVDAVAAVYEKTDDFTRDDIFSTCSRVKPSGFASLVNKVLNPFYTSYNYRKIDYDAIAADYYSLVAQPALAEARRRKRNEH